LFPLVKFQFEGIWGLLGLALIVFLGAVAWKGLSNYDDYLGATGVAVIGTLLAIVPIGFSLRGVLPLTDAMLAFLLLIGLVFIAAQGWLLCEARKEEEKNRREWERSAFENYNQLVELALAVESVQRLHGFDAETPEGKWLIEALIPSRASSHLRM
jgi:hypothetical protein